MKRNKAIEYHIIQSFPVTCLNRDDVGAPKTAVVGGVTRARVSSQCWKRQVRLALRDFGVRLGMRTKKLQEVLIDRFVANGHPQETISEVAEHIVGLLSDDTLLFVSDSEVDTLVAVAVENEFDKSKLKVGVIEKALKNISNRYYNALDIGLFGRMVAKAPSMQVEAAASFAHAISTHQVSNEVEFFTALDDLQNEPGSAHMGSLEFNSATYYRYVSLNLGQLQETIGAEEIAKAVDAFTRALFVAVPAARQTTQSGASSWEFARVLVRSGQRLQVPFETPVTSRHGGYLEPSIDALTEYLDKKERLAGSLYGKIAGWDWGRDSNFSIDDLCENLKVVSSGAINDE